MQPLPDSAVRCFFELQRWLKPQSQALKIMKRTTTTETESSSEELIENLRQLIDEAQGILTNGVAEKSRETLAELRARLEDGIEKLSTYYGDAKKKVVAGARRTDETIRSHPYESLAVALGVGVLIGALVRGGRKD
jgi:ElaB/YqjD/DUF883 family membrane-anchored ribosome-binding protein